MGLIQMGVPEDITLFLKEIFKSDLFIETGTFYGGTASWASKYFKKVHTIEFSEPIYNATSEKLAHISNINFHFGDTRTLLNKILLEEHASQNAILWLDAHWSSGLTYGQNDECPLLKELEILSECKQEVCILIDDARLFLAPPPLPHNCNQYPSIQEIFNAYKKDAFITVYNDVIIIIPSYQKDAYQKFLQAKTTTDWNETSRLKEDSLLSDFKKLLKNILKKSRININKHK
jgi:hypothetical protein